MKKKCILISLVTVLLTATLIWLIWGNVTVGLTHITVTEDDLPDAFDGYRIAHVSDLHNSGLWSKAIERLIEAQPDVICITGDIADSRAMDIQTALDFAAEAVKIAPCYYVTGNHEARFPEAEYDQLISGLTSCGVKVLLDAQVLIERHGQTVCLVGHSWGETSDIGKLSDFDGYKILLSHHPESFSDYVAGEYDLVLCGHAHGGQFRLPFVGGLFAPGQGLFPAYDSGLYNRDQANMVVSRGIGNSAFPIRFNNRPEVILITLQCG